MKKIFVGAVCVLAAATMFVSCGKSTPKADMKDDVDSLSYALGVAQSQGLREYLGQLGVDSTQIDEFIKGMNDAVNAGEDKKKAAYFAGVMIGNQINKQMISGINHELYGNDSTKTISVNNFMAAFVETVKNEKHAITPEAAQALVQTKLQAIKAKAAEEKYGENRAAGEKFLAQNKKQPGVVTLPSGLQYKVLKEGKGALPTDTTQITLNYEGKTIDGKVFDSSFKRGEPVTIRPNQFIPGFTEALKLMPAGSTWEIYIPQNLAYGAQEQGPIKPFSALIFKVEVISFK